MSALSSDEIRYQESERQLFDRWEKLPPEILAKHQMDMKKIPGWLNAPAWAHWLQFCSLRGWCFVSEQPHRYTDGVITANVKRLSEARKIRGVIFFENKHGYSAESSPFWFDERRNALAGGAK